MSFGNGGGLQTQGFKLDIPGTSITDEELGELFVRHLGLLMVESVRISGRTLVQEAHKGSRGVERAGQDRRSIELSHPIEDGMVTYPGLPGPEIGDHMSFEDSRAVYAPGTEFQIGRISMVSNTGTYLDTPSHRFDGKDDLGALALSRIAGLDGVVVRVTGAEGRAIDRAALVPHDVRGRAALIHTGWARHWRTEQYGSGHPYLTIGAAEWLVEQGAALVGIDSLNIDDTGDGRRPAHTALLAAGIPIVEHMRGLEQLPPNGFRFHAAPPLVRGMGTFPVRAYALIDETA